MTIQEPGQPTNATAAPRTGLGRRALRFTALILVVRVLSRLVALVTVVVIGQTLGADHFGELQTAVTYGAIVSIVADFGFATLYVREGSRRPHAISALLDFALSVRVLLSGVATPLLLLALWFAGVQSLFVPTLAILVVGGFLMLLRGTLYALQRLNFEIAEIVPESLLLLGLVLVGATRHADSGYFLWAYAASYAAAAAYFLVVLLAKGLIRPRWSIDMGLIRPWLGAGVALSITYVLTTVYFKVDVPILQRFRPYAEVGWYTLAYKPFEALLFVPVTLRSVVFPVLSIYNAETPQRILPTAEKFFKALCMLGWPMTVGIFMLTPQLTELLHLFPECAPALHILSLALVFAFVDNTFYAVWYATDRQRLFAYIALSGLLFNVILNLLLIPRYGYIGASVCTAATEAWMVGVGLFTLRRQFGPLRFVRMTWRVLLAGVVMGAFLFVVNPHGRAALLLTIGAAAGVYALALLALRAFDSEDWAAIKGALSPRDIQPTPARER